MNRIAILLLLLFFCACHPTYVKMAPGGLPAYLSADNPSLPPVSAHRGGRNYPKKPENSLAVFRYVLRHTPAMIECDVQLTRDSVLVLMHDKTLDRTSTGTGPLSQLSYEELRALRLEDDFGQVTRHKIPSLASALRWAKGKAILSLDVKRGVPWEMVIDAVREAEAQDYVVLIAYRPEDAETIYRLAPEFPISCGVQRPEDLEKYSFLPTDQMLAFTGTKPVPTAVFAALAQRNIPAMQGTMSGLDEQARQLGDSIYLELLSRGANILATDRPIEAAPVVKTWREGQKIKTTD